MARINLYGSTCRKIQIPLGEAKKQSTGREWGEEQAHHCALSSLFLITKTSDFQAKETPELPFLPRQKPL